MQIQHDCNIPAPVFPGGVRHIRKDVRCSECGQWWAGTWFVMGGSQAERVSPPWPNLKKFLWKRKMKKEIRLGWELYL